VLQFASVVGLMALSVLILALATGVAAVERRAK
jgi:apolipoprotein N-acyltransferase